MILKEPCEVPAFKGLRKSLCYELVRNKGFLVGWPLELYMSHVLYSLTGSAAPKILPPLAPGMGLKGPPFGESFYNIEAQSV